MPQLDPSSFLSQLFWLAITFSVLYVMLSRVILPTISRVLQTRQERITNDLEKADSIRREAEKMAVEYEAQLAESRAKAQTMIAETVKKLDQESQARRDELDGVLQRKVSDADKKLQASRAAAMAKLEPQAVELVTMIVNEVSNLKITQKQAEDAVKNVSVSGSYEMPSKMAAGE
ncbi:MAG: F0F1 ATP synthase subunit B' [Proteobacteria bacterium]|nr:F0F1 ATP synthase subunit B' [Pseudomonadota bacterium]